MALMRALDSGVTGMLGNQLTLDVSSNNLANVNTPGFKGSRVSFSSSLVQTLFSGSAPGTNVGGQNPRQVGLGIQTTSIDVDMGQGALQATGRDLDLAIQGEGFFEVTDGTRSFYTRVGSFGTDAESNLIHQGTGFRIRGNTYRPDTNPDGSQSIQDQNVDIEIPFGEAFPPSQTSEIQFQGNLDSNTNALRGNSLASVYQLRDSLSDTSATESTALGDLNIFKDTNGIAGDPLTLYMYGTKPNGEAFASEATIHPWDNPSAGNSRGSVGELLAEINDALVQGNERFGTARMDNGSLIISSVGSGDGFSFFFGEGGPVDSENPIGGRLSATTVPAFGNLDGTAVPFAGTTTTVASHTIAASEHGLLIPAFTMNSALLPGQSVSVSIGINGNEKGTIAFDAADPAGIEKQLSSFPHVSEGDVITYSISGTGSTNFDFETELVSDLNSANLTSDADLDGAPDLFEDGTGVDPNEWTYRNGTNTNFNWYRMRTVPDVVSSSIEVFDSQGGRHNVEARFFRVGSKTEASSDARINSWDMIINVPSDEGTVVDDLVTGIEFDQQGRFNGSIGTTVQNSTLNATQHVGSPSTSTIQVNWTTTGPTDPATIRMDFGTNNSTDGLTGFGSQSTAAAVDQDGFTDGKLDTLNVSSEGDIIALYTNGISRKIAQIPLVTFQNPSGLEAQEGSLWAITTNSGNPTRRTPGQNSGFVTSGALESANVDIATEFTRLITAQRGFQVSARVIQTTDEILEELANLVR